VGLRPLVKAHEEAGGNTQKISREHTILVSRSGLVTVTGGKWTTYRAMAEDVLDVCAGNALLENRAKGLTQHLSLVGGSQQGVTPCALSQPPGLHSYGDEQAQVTALRGAERVLCEGLTEAMVRFAARYEYALTVEDVLARRSRLLFLDARLASKVAPQVGQILREENKIDPQLSQFLELTERYLHLPV
jgi:glycerol-3-phosphate dehydrogenase